MRLFLSSYRFGAYQQRLRQLVGTPCRTVLIANALDGLPDSYRAVSIRRDLADLAHAGLPAEVVDLRHSGATKDLASYDLIWIRGGNTFVLRRALADSGADVLIRTWLEEDSVAYGGYSAGASVLSPDLTPLQTADDITCVSRPITTGLGILDRALIPHVDTADHPESAVCTAISASLLREGKEHWALADGDVLVIDGDQIELLKADPLLNAGPWLKADPRPR